MFSGCSQIMWAHSHLIWAGGLPYSQIIWAGNDRCYQAETVYVLKPLHLLNPSQVTGSLDPKSLSVMQGMEMAYVHFEPQPNGFFYSWRSLRVIDLEMLDDQPKSDHFAFAAIVDVTKEATRTRSFSISAFPYNSGLTLQQNITTRVGVLAINDVDRRNQRKLQDSNWRLLVDWPRARRSVARLIQRQLTR